MVRRIVLSIAVWLFAVGAMLQPDPAKSLTFAFDDRDAFETIISILDPVLITKRENWDTFAPSTILPDGTIANGITYDVTQGNAVVVDTGQSLSPPNNLFTTAGSSGFAPLTDRFIFSFEKPIVAFGINFVSSAANTDGAFFAETSLGNILLSGFDPVVPGVNVSFLGLISTNPFDSVSIGANVNALYGLDDMTFSTVVPLPAALPLLASGILGLLFLARRRKTLH